MPAATLRGAVDTVASVGKPGPVVAGRVRRARRVGRLDGWCGRDGRGAARRGRPRRVCAARAGTTGWVLRRGGGSTAAVPIPRPSARLWPGRPPGCLRGVRMIVSLPTERTG
eukprot:scaffold4613_cov129-Isochrysis_galbana.AAC.8